MKKIELILVIWVLSVVVASLAFAQQKENAPKPGGVAVEVIEWSGKVTAVDYQKRTVTLQGRGISILLVSS